MLLFGSINSFVAVQEKRVKCVDCFDYRLSSASSSIFDLSVESEALERAIRTNEISVVKKLLEVSSFKFYKP